MNKLYLLTQEEKNGYDTYDSVVVCAANEEEAKTIHPNEDEPKLTDTPNDESFFLTWATCTKNVHAEEIGIAHDNQKIGVILASFNAG